MTQSVSYLKPQTSKETTNFEGVGSGRETEPIAIGSDYSNIQHGDRDSINAYTNLGGVNCITANRISYVFDLKGSSMTVDTACSSSLIAVHLACQSIWNGESTQAISEVLLPILSSLVILVVSR